MQLNKYSSDDRLEQIFQNGQRRLKEKQEKRKNNMNKLIKEIDVSFTKEIIIPIKFMQDGKEILMEDIKISPQQIIEDTKISFEQMVDENESRKIRDEKKKLEEQIPNKKYSKSVKRKEFLTKEEKQEDSERFFRQAAYKNVFNIVDDALLEDEEQLDLILKRIIHSSDIIDWFNDSDDTKVRKLMAQEQTILYQFKTKKNYGTHKNDYCIDTDRLIQLRQEFEEKPEKEKELLNKQSAEYYDNRAKNKREEKEKARDEEKIKNILEKKTKKEEEEKEKIQKENRKLDEKIKKLEDKLKKK